MKRPARSLPDTNIIVRYLIKDDIALYTKAKGFFDKVMSGSEKAVILESIIAECIYVLTKIYKVPKEMAAGRLIDILRYKGISNNDQKELIHALTLFSEENIDIVDCILCTKASGSGGHLISFDEKLNKMARRA